MRSPILIVTGLAAEDEAAWREELAKSMPEEMIVTKREPVDLSSVEIAIVANPPMGSLRDTPNLRWVHSLWAGVDCLVQDETLPAVPIVRLVDPALAGIMSESVAAAVLHFHRDLHVYAAQQRRKEWRQHPARNACERPISVLGLGNMGATSASLLAMLGFDVQGWSRSQALVPGVRTFWGRDHLSAAIERAEILVNLLPLTNQTRGILSRDLFARLAPGACLINFGRGGHLVEADLLDALTSGQIAHAVLDVFDHEPLPVDHIFWTHPRVTVLPHVAAPTNKTSAAAVVAAAVETYRKTGLVPLGVDRRQGY